MMVFAKTRLNMEPPIFWQLTFAEWLPMYEAIMGKVERPMTKDDHEDLLANYLKQFEKQGHDGNT
jgi:hypothetical protein